ncbi:hypothetical protein [Streptomyces parvus]|uniref:Uncharacterized protein n=1 Tax=Streptomyces parvus TaxID=66428 RepID=A0A5D4JD42_9ACTN|nr:hypothetical protein [Streptomyces parvus]TYR62714.1 hypothetical protein FY004_18330 [Streptomyces parvus]
MSAPGGNTGAELLIVPPLTDFTTSVVPPQTAELLDLSAHFVRRIADPARLEEAAARLDTQTAGREEALHALFATAAAAVLRRPGPGIYDRARLRATGMALRLVGESDPALTLSLDDLELRDGTTESGAAVVAAAARTGLFAPEIELARQRAGGSQDVQIMVDTDQQLPVAIALVQALGAHRTILCGRFAAQHQQALGLLQATREVRINDGRPSRIVRTEWAGRPHHAVHWATDPLEATPDRPWAGWLDATDTTAVPAAAWRTCTGLTLTVARLDSWETATGVYGRLADLSVVWDRLRADVPVAVELLVGAPGADTKTLRAAINRIVGRTPDAGPARPRPVLAGLRPFRLPRDGGPTWNAVPVRAEARPDHDLARWAEFTAPGTLTPQGRLDTIHALLAELARSTDFFPGRMAGALTTMAPLETAEQLPVEQPVWDPSAQVVATEQADPDGRGPGTFVAHLRTGAAFRLHPRLAPVVSALADGKGEQIKRLPAATRTKLLGQLARAGALRRNDT